MNAMKLPLNVEKEKWEEIIDFAFERYFRKASLIGTKETCLETINRLKEIGVDEVACLIDFGVDVSSSLKGLEHLNEVKEEEKRRAENTRRAQIDAKQMREYLRKRLPEYMQPAAVVVLEEFPLMPNGKVDRNGLPDEAQSPKELKERQAARNPIEELLVEMLSEVLGRERISITDNFFELGGHSLQATQLVSRIRKAFKVELELKKLFEAPTVAVLATMIEKALRGHEAIQAVPILPVPRDVELPLSYAQQRLWFLHELEPDSPVYNTPAALRLTGQLKVDALEKSFSEIVRRHEVLRTVFPSVEGRPVQVITPARYMTLPMVDLRELDDPERHTRAVILASHEAQQGFDLARGPLIRLGLLELAEQDHVVLLTMAHIVTDGWSTRIIIEELGKLYRAFLTATESPLDELEIQYADFAHWQRAWLRGEVIERQLTYWKEQLRGAAALLDLPTDRSRPATQTTSGAYRTFVVSKELADELKSLGRQEGATLYVILLAAFQTLLYRYTGQSDVNVGTLIANRNRSEIERLIGFFVNTLVMRGDLRGTLVFREFISQIREVALGAYAHQDLPFEQLVQALEPERSMSHSPLFQVMFALQSAPMGSLDLEGLGLAKFEIESRTAHFDLMLEITDFGNGIVGGIEYNTDLFDDTTIRRMIGHFQTLLLSVVRTPDEQLSGLRLLTESEGWQMLVEWNQEVAEYERDKCIHELFEQQVVLRPHATAIVHNQEQLSYGELDRRANHLANYLRRLGVGPETIVGLCIDKGPDMVAAIFAVLKAGGAYLPLDSANPKHRLRLMIEDAGVQLLLTHQPAMQALPEFRATMVCLESQWERMTSQSYDRPESLTGSDNLAYVIFTSGSTGEPKAVMVQHRSVCNLAEAQGRAFGVSHASRVLQFASYGFDASVSEIFVALLNSATLVIGRPEQLMPMAGLAEFFSEERITVATLPPTVGGLLEGEELESLESIVVAGEACPTEVVSRLSRAGKVLNAYGPTEATVCATIGVCRVGEGRPSIGRPISNVGVYILDEQMSDVPVSVAGELYIAGSGLARGYRGRAADTAERFVPDPHSQEAGARLYRTGDISRYLADGRIDYIARRDQQVKVRGHRIELGEVEAVLKQYPGIVSAVVLVSEDRLAGKTLTAYTVSKEESPLSIGEVRDFLRQRLPEYMIPPSIIEIEAIPLSANGKVDKSRLQSDFVRTSSQAGLELPRTPLEEVLAGVWADVLALEQVGIHDSFFDLGGHSLLGAVVRARMQEIFPLDLPLRRIFQSKTVAEMAEYFDAAGSEAGIDVDKIARVLLGLNPLADDEIKELLAEYNGLFQDLSQDRP
jgi:amino acid adenylation domain-containing protein